MKPRGLGTTLPNLKWNDREWTAGIALPAWKGFLSRLGPYNSSSSTRRSAGKALLRVLTAKDECVEPTVHQQKAWADLAANQEAIRDVILRALVKEYARFRRDDADMLHAPMFEEAFDTLPNRVSKPDELRKLIGLASVFIHATSEGGVAHVGYGFGCAWEEEHGLGVMMHRRRVLAVGHEDVAFMADAYVAPLRPTRKNARRKNGPLKPERLNFEVIQGNLSRVKKLLAAGALPEKRYNPACHNAIETAAIQGHAVILSLLLEHTKKPVKVRPITFYIKDKPNITAILDEYGVEETA